jgi:hypothetical protein
MAMNTYADVAGYVQTVYEDAMFVARDNNILGGLVQTFSDLTGDAPRTNSNYGTATMSSIAETDDLASQSFTPAPYKTLTPSEAGGQVFITDRRIDNDPSGARADASQELGNAMAQKIELDLISDFPSLTGGTIGGGGTVATWAHLFAAEAILKNAQAPGRYAVVMNSFQWFALGTAPSIMGAARNAPSFQDRVQSNVIPQGVFSIGNLDIYLTANIPAGTAGVAAMFAKPAIALDTRRAPRLEPERDASRRGWELNLTAVYAHGVWRPEWGVKMTFTGTVPTGV